MKVERIAECSRWSILQYFGPALSDNWSSFFNGRLRRVLLCNQQSIYIYAYKWVHTIRRDPRFNYPGSMVGGVGST